MPRFILRYRGSGGMPAEALDRVRDLAGVEIVEHSPRMILVEGSEEELREALESLPDWVLLPAEERMYRVPDTKHKIREQ